MDAIYFEISVDPSMNVEDADRKYCFYVSGEELPGGKPVILCMGSKPWESAYITEDPNGLRGIEDAIKRGGLESKTIESGGALTYSHIRAVRLPDSTVLMAVAKAKQIDNLEAEVDKAVKELLGLQVVNYGANIPL